MDFCWAVDDLRWYLKTRKVRIIVQNFFQREDYHWEQVSWRRCLILPSSFASSCCTNLVLFIVIYHFNTQGISFIAEANNKVKRGQNNSKTRNHSPSIRLKGFESARILWRSSLSSSRQFSSSSSSMLWRPSQSSLMSSSSWGRQLLCESSNEEWRQHRIDLLWRFEVALTQWWLLPCLWHRYCRPSFA